MAGIVAYFYTKLTEGNSSAGNSLAG